MINSNQKPKPPPGYVPYPKSNRGKTDPCPVCDARIGQGGGQAWNGGGWQAPEAQAKFDKHKAYLDDWRKRLSSGQTTTEKEPYQHWPSNLLSHWSRYGTGYCCSCKTKIWHTFNPKWEYFYELPPTNKRNHLIKTDHKQPTDKAQQLHLF